MNSDAAEVKSIACKMYETGIHSFASIAKQIGCSITRTTKILKEAGYVARKMSDIKRKYPLNERYFDNIGPDQAYILGLLMADGTNCTKRGLVRLRLVETDSDVLREITKRIQPSKPLYFESKQSAIKRGIKAANQLGISISSRKVSNRLCELGIAPNKTFITAYPDWVTRDLAPDFLRGLFDGDGYYQSDGCGLTGTTPLLTSVASVVMEEIGVYCGIYRHISDGISSLQIRGGKQTRRFYEFLDRSGGMSIERKRESRSQAIASAPQKKKPAECAAPECTRSSHALGLCGMHYKRYKKHGQLDLPEITRPSRQLKPKPVCASDGCSVTSAYAGLCVNCYAREWRKRKKAKQMINGDSQSAKELRRFCWLCGATPSSKPEGWFAPFGLEVAHIASGQGDALRVQDRRAVTVLCSLCHRLHVNHAGGTMTINGVEYPTIDARHTLWVKAKMDPKYYDRRFLAKYWHGTLPDPERPPEFFLDQLAKNQGLLL